AARGQPQRRAGPLRARPAALHRLRRRRRGGRPARAAGQRPEPRHAARQDLAHRPAAERRAPIPRAGVEPVRRPAGRPARDLRLRPAQPMAVLVRPPDRRPDDRRRRGRSGRRGRLRAPRECARAKLRLAAVGGAPAQLQRARPGRRLPGPAALPPRRQLLDHGRLRRARPRRPRALRPLRLRRLLRGTAAGGDAAPGARGQPAYAAAAPGPRAVVVRRGRAGPRLRDLAGRRRLAARAVTIDEALARHDVGWVRAANPSALTLSGTNTWVLGRDPCYVVDPGPLLADHVEAVLAEAQRRG